MIKTTKNMYAMISRIIPYFPEIYVPYLPKLTSHCFKIVLEIKQPQVIVNILLTLSQLFIQHPTACICNRETILSIYSVVASQIPSFKDIFQVLLQVLS